jgi:hypothetical protein
MDFKNLSGFSSEQYLAGDKGVIVYLESTDDVFIFKKWFGNLLSKIQFEPVSGEKANGGCRAVIQRLQELDDFTVDYYGIVDRDALLNEIRTHESLWWEIDDNVFFGTSPFGDRVFVLNRWELENYLLHPKALAKRLYNRTMGKISYTDASQLANDILQREDDLVAVTVLATLGRGDRSPRYLQSQQGQTLWNQIQQDTNADNAKIELHKQNIIRFAESQAEPLQRWDRLSRMVDGKRAMVRIEGMFTEHKFCIENERADLADDIANLNLIDPHLYSWVHRLVTPEV